MGRRLRKCFGGAAIAVASWSAFCTAASGAASESGPSVVFRIVNLTEVPKEVVETATKLAAKIYRHSGIRVEFLDGDAAKEVRGDHALELTMALVSESVAETMHAPKETTGFAIGNNGRGIRRAYIFVERVRQQALLAAPRTGLGENITEGLILGQVIAHEAGHLMLPHGAHSQHGIMQARLSMRDVEQARRGLLVFTPEQTRLIRSVLLNGVEAD